MKRVAILGFGEAGSILGEDLARRGCDVLAYDVLFSSRKGAAELGARAESAGVVLVADPMEALRAAELAISAVTASSSTEAARGAAQCLRKGQVYLDINSVSPGTRRFNAELIEASGAAFVEAAVMAPVPPRRLAVPMLLGGPHARSVAPVLRALGMNVNAFADEIGPASAAKMCRSVVIKGLEALTAEALFAARSYGVEEYVLESLAHTYPQMGWLEGFPDYTISRIAEHGARRAAEMEEVARTLQEVGRDPQLPAAVAACQRGLVEAMRLQRTAYSKEAPFSWRSLFEALQREREQGREPDDRRPLRGGASE